MTEKQFCSIKDAAQITGLSAKFIRQNIEKIPHGKSGRKYLVCMVGFALYSNIENLLIHQYLVLFC